MRRYNNITDLQLCFTCNSEPNRYILDEFTKWAYKRSSDGFFESNNNRMCLMQNAAKRDGSSLNGFSERDLEPVFEYLLTHFEEEAHSELKYAQSWDENYHYPRIRKYMDKLLDYRKQSDMLKASKNPCKEILLKSDTYCFYQHKKEIDLFVKNAGQIHKNVIDFIASGTQATLLENYLKTKGNITMNFSSKATETKSFLFGVEIATLTKDALVTGIKELKGQLNDAKEIAKDAESKTLDADVAELAASLKSVVKVLDSGKYKKAK